MDIADVGGIENSAAVNGIEGKAMSIEFDSPREERIKALIEKYYPNPNLITDTRPPGFYIEGDGMGRGAQSTCSPNLMIVPRADFEEAIRAAVALGEDLKQEELVCSGCHRKQDLPWYCKDCENKVGGGGGSILPLDRIGNDVWHKPRWVNQNGSEG